jgi:hypothetical protein
VDILNPKYLNRHLKACILQSAFVQYEASHAASSGVNGTEYGPVRGPGRSASFSCRASCG